MKEAVVLMPLRPTKDIAQDEMTQYEVALVKSLSEKYVVYSGQRVQEKLNAAYLKVNQQTGPGKECDDTKCQQDVAIAFQTEFVATANIRKTGGGYSISLSIKDVIEDKSVFSDSIPCEKCNEFDVIRQLKTIAGGSASPVVAQAAAPPAPPAPSAPAIPAVAAATHEGIVYVKKGDGGFYMDKTEVTQGAYQLAIGSNPSHFTSCPTCPVEQVTWFEAETFCKKLGKRLPTEAEWEWAATSGGKDETYAGTSDKGKLGDFAWYEVNSNVFFSGTTHPVGEKEPNGLSLYDMSGNVAEWTDSWYDDGKKYRVLRGGSWGDNANKLRAAYRHGSTPLYRNGGNGFRCSQ